ncbi:MAG: Tetratricopeptide 2 repeat protein, partial [Bryobacterales bacterium]|nr:Tetratricopeptide 2 repeat protein [Bryobacterales bacterium]
RLFQAVLFVFPIICSAASKEIVELQRDVAQLQDQVRNLQSGFDTKLAALTVLVQQAVDSSNKATNSLAGLQGGIQEQMRQQGREVVAPVAGLGTRVEEMSNSFQQLQNSMADVSARLTKIEQQMLDLKNAVSTIGNPAAPPPSNIPGGSGPGPTSSGPPPSGEMLYQNANRDRLGGKNDLAVQEFNDYLKYYPEAPLAPAAQFWIGNIYFAQGDYENAVKAFDAVLERFPANNKTPDAMLWKGKALVKLDKRNAGANEFRELVRRYPGSEAATSARAQLKLMGLSAGTGASRRR